MTDVLTYPSLDVLQCISFLQLLDEYLNEFDAIPVTSQISIQPKVLQPSRYEVAFPVGEYRWLYVFLQYKQVLNIFFICTAFVY